MMQTAIVSSPTVSANAARACTTRLVMRLLPTYRSTKPFTDWLHMQVGVAPRRPVRASVVVKASKSDNAVSQGPKLALIVPGKISLTHLP